MYFQAMFGGSRPNETADLLGGQLYAPYPITVMAVAILLLFTRQQAHDWSQQITWPKAMIIVPLFVVALLTMVSQSSNPFLYFQF